MQASHPTQADALILLINEVRSTFHLLKLLARELHGGGELTAARRGVMSDLLQGGAQTVPSLARTRPVSRQHIQSVVNALREGGFVELLENPAHKRSRLVSLTRRGRERIEQMLELERSLLEGLDLGPEPDEIIRAAELLEGVKGKLASLRAPALDE